MSKVAQYLQQHVVGEVLTSPDAREYFSTDGSIFKIIPQIIVYPRAENDVRKIARFSWQLAERGRLVPLTARGSGTDMSGASLGQGVMIVFPAHMNKVLTLDSSKGFVSVQPGINYGKLQQTLLTHRQFLPPYPAWRKISKIRSYQRLRKTITSRASQRRGYCNKKAIQERIRPKKRLTKL